MLKSMKNPLFIPVLTICLVSFARADCPVGDLNRDCQVNSEDLQVLAERWLEPPGSPADLNGDDDVDMADLTLLAKDWRQVGIPLVINELMASNSSSTKDPQGEYDDWIEIYNAGDTVIDLGGMYLTDDLSEPTRWRIPDNNPAATIVLPRTHLLIWADNDTSDGALHANFNLNAGGEDLGLFAADGSTRIDRISFGEQVADISYGHFPDASDNLRFMAVPTPGGPNIGIYQGFVAEPKFSHDRGFYDAPFELTVTCATEGAVICYTLDGSEPYDSSSGASSTARVYTDPIRIQRTTCLRTVAFKPGWMPTHGDTHTYIFLADVLAQSRDGRAPPGWPTSSVNGQIFDYGMDPDIVDSAQYGPLMIEAMQQIPSISLVTDMDNLVDPATGIYVNARNEGANWERPTSVELINPDGSQGFQTNAGLRIRGAWSRTSNNPKHSFRLLFKAAYGASRLEFPMFGDEGVEEFDNIDLRTAQNWTWSNNGANDGRRNTFIRDVYARDLSREMGQPYTRSRYYHLYLNGQYWGLYQSQERSEASYAESYFGGDTEDYDVIKTESYRTAHTDGSMNVWNALWYLCEDGFESDTKYYAVQGKKPDGTDDPNIPVHVDVENLIDYMLDIFFTGNRDAPVTLGGDRSNNFFAIRSRRPEVRQGWKFFVYDSEHSMLSTSDDRTAPVAAGQTISHFNPQWLHQKLMAHPEYRMQFADRAHRCFFNGGIMTPENAAALCMARAKQIDLAIIAESARWGDHRSDSGRTNNPYTKADWWAEVNGYLINSFFPVRSQIVLGQLRNRGLYPNVVAPSFNKHGGHVARGFQLSMTAPSGTIYYTLDRSDPRLPATVAPPGPSTILVTEDAAKRVLVPTGPIADTWKGSGPFDDSLWTSGHGGVGYERNSGYESFISIDVETQMHDKNATCYIRIPFTVGSDEMADFNFMRLQMRYEDGFVAYLNGLEVARKNFAGPPAWNSNADALNSDSAAVMLESVDISDHLSALRPGDNMLAIHGLNVSTTSSDFLISVRLIAGESSSPGGTGILPTAVEYTGLVTLTETTQVKARVLSGGAWSALNEAVFAIGPVAQNLRITEIMYNPQDTSDPNDPNEEFIELQNTGAETLNLNLVRFTNGIDFTFPAIELAADEYVLVVKDIDAFEAQYGPGYNTAGQYSGNLRNGGERIELQDAAGQTILNFRYRDGWYAITDGMGFSLTVKDAANTDPNAWSEKSTWRPSAAVGGSPGRDDTDEVPALGSVKINELLAHSHAGASDWIELHNTTDRPINIGGWFLSDDSDDLMKYEIADGTWIDPCGYTVFYQSEHFGNMANPGCHSAFALSENGETLYLHSGRDGILTGYSEEEKFGASETGVAFGRHRKSTGTYNFVAMSENTPGSANAYPKVGPVVISEIMYHPQNNADAEYVELLNISGAPVVLQEWDNEQARNVPWRFADEGGISFDFPLGTTLVADERILLVRHRAAFESEFGAVDGGIKVFEWQLGRLDNGGEKIDLARPGDEVDGTRYYIRVDRVNYSDGSHPPGEDPWPVEPDGSGASLSRLSPQHYGNDPDNWTAADPATPGE